MIGHIHRNGDGEIDLERLVIPLHRADGEIGAWCLAIPFLRPGDVPRAATATATAAAADGAPPPDPYLEGIALLYRQAFALAESKRGAGQAIVAMGHCHMVDGQASLDSERRIVIGGTEALPGTVFDPAIAYAALGHLHLAQRVGQHEHRRYCGSPLPLSFAEVGYQHQVLRIDLEGGAVREVAALLVPRASTCCACRRSRPRSRRRWRRSARWCCPSCRCTRSPTLKSGSCSTPPNPACAGGSRRRSPASRCGWQRSSRPQHAVRRRRDDAHRRRCSRTTSSRACTLRFAKTPADQLSARQLMLPGAGEQP
jgi:hypothetical protein